MEPDSSGSAAYIDFSRLDPDPVPVGQKRPTKIESSDKISCLTIIIKCFMLYCSKYTYCTFRSAGCSLLWVEGISCSLDVLRGGLEMNILQFLIKKIDFHLNHFTIFGRQNRIPYWIRNRFRISIGMICWSQIMIHRYKMNRYESLVLPDWFGSV